MNDEPRITVNGKPLTVAQAMTVRVAVGNFLLELQDANFVRDLGEIGPLYRRRLIEISELMMQP
jgi:hypothetical protein